jgi:hypothetical protein
LTSPTRSINAGTTARLQVRQSESGAYTVELNADGTLTLYRNDTILDVINTQALIPQEWHTLRLAVIENTVRVALDDIEIMAQHDSAPLPAGMVTFGGVFASEHAGLNFLRADDIIIRGIQSEQPIEARAAEALVAPLDTGDSGTCLQVVSGVTAYPEEQIVFHQWQGGTQREELVILNVNEDPPILTTLTDNPGYVNWQASMSPDGRQVALSSNCAGSFDIWIISIDGSTTPINLTDSLFSTTDNETSPAWSPDGSQIAFVGDAQGNWDIYIVDVAEDNQTLQRLTWECPRLCVNPSDDTKSLPCLQSG